MSLMCWNVQKRAHIGHPTISIGFLTRINSRAARLLSALSKFHPVVKSSAKPEAMPYWG